MPKSLDIPSGLRDEVSAVVFGYRLLAPLDVEAGVRFCLTSYNGPPNFEDIVFVSDAARILRIRR